MVHSIDAKEPEHKMIPSMDDGRRGSSLATITGIKREHDMPDAQASQSDEEGSSRSGNRYVYTNAVGYWRFYSVSLFFCVLRYFDWLVKALILSNTQENRRRPGCNRRR